MTCSFGRLTLPNVLFCFIIAILLAACGTQDSTRGANALLTPLPAEYTTLKDPSNARLEEAIKDYLETAGAPANTRYDFTRIDLNDDTRRDAIVMMKTPYAHWCGLHGCSMAVFRAHNDGFILISEISPVRGPVTVSEDYTNGWRDLVVRVSGRIHWDARHIAMKFDGASYPSRPHLQEPMTVACGSPVQGMAIFP